LLRSRSTALIRRSESYIVLRHLVFESAVRTGQTGGWTRSTKYSRVKHRTEVIDRQPILLVITSMTSKIIYVPKPTANVSQFKISINVAFANE